MPRDYGQADRQLAQQLGVEPRQIERWRSEGCLQPPQWLHQPGMPGSRSLYPAGAAEQAARVRDLLADRAAMFAGPKMTFNEVRIMLFWADRFVDEVKLRASYLAFLERLDRPLRAADVKDAMHLAGVLRRQAGGGFRQWTKALRIANTVARAGGADPAARIELALAVLLTVMSGGTPSSDLPGGPDDLVADAIDNLGFGGDETIAAGDLAFLDLGAARDLIKRADYAELQQARDMTKAIMGYADTLAYIGSRTDRSLRWPAFSIVFKKVIKNSVCVTPLCLPFAVASRQQFGAEWDDHIADLVRQADAVASLLRALPPRLHRLVPVNDGQVKASARQLSAFQAAFSVWAEKHPDLVRVILRN